MSGAVFAAFGGILLIAAIVFIGPYPNPGWTAPAVWLVSGCLGISGILSIVVGMLVIQYAGNEDYL